MLQQKPELQMMILIDGFVVLLHITPQQLGLDLIIMKQLILIIKIQQDKFGHLL